MTSEGGLTVEHLSVRRRRPLLESSDAFTVTEPEMPYADDEITTIFDAASDDAYELTRGA